MFSGKKHYFYGDFPVRYFDITVVGHGSVSGCAISAPADATAGMVHTLDGRLCPTGLGKSAIIFPGFSALQDSTFLRLVGSESMDVESSMVANSTSQQCIIMQVPYLNGSISICLHVCTNYLHG